jgi:hypothetical protein
MKPDKAPIDATDSVEPKFELAAQSFAQLVDGQAVAFAKNASGGCGGGF